MSQLTINSGGADQALVLTNQDNNRATFRFRSDTAIMTAAISSSPQKGKGPRGSSIMRHSVEVGLEWPATVAELSAKARIYFVIETEESTPASMVGWVADAIRGFLTAPVVAQLRSGQLLEIDASA